MSAFAGLSGIFVQHYLTSMSELSLPRYCEEKDAGNQAPAAAAILQRAPLPAIIFQEDNCVTTNIGPQPTTIQTALLNFQ